MIIKKEKENPNFLAFINAKGLKDGDEVGATEYESFLDEEVAAFIKGKFKEPFHIYLWRKYKVYTDEELDKMLKEEEEGKKLRMEHAAKLARYGKGFKRV